MQKLYKFKKLVGVILYYSACYYLPDNNMPVIGRICTKFRASVLHLVNSKISRKTNICSRVYLGNLQDLSIDDYSGLGRHFTVRNAVVKIGKMVMTGKNILVLGGGHRFDRTDIPMGKQGSLPKTNLVIEDDVWIGERVTIMAKNITIGKGSVVGACSVVTKSVPPYAVVAGNPAKIIKYRK
jgi:maltose O-acetyltransferase